MTPEQARALFLEHCQPGDRGTLERYGEKAAVAAIMEVVPDLLAALKIARGQVVALMIPQYGVDTALANVRDLDAAIAKATGAA